jgi:NADH dehydrogenase FAD-containing subunit
MPHNILILGAGYTGAIAAGRLAKRLHGNEVTITLVNAEPDFVERVRMHQLATGQPLKPRPFSEIFANTSVTVKLARVTAIDTETRTVSVTSVATSPAPDQPAEELPYDTLVYALGSTWTTHETPGVTDHAHELASRPGALRLRDRLAALPAGSTVTVVGGGLTGLEASTEIAESRPDLNVALATRTELGAWLSPKARRHLRKVFRTLNITTHESTSVAAVSGTHITTTEGTEIPSALTVWTTGFAAHPLARTTSLKLSETDQIIVDATMRSISHPDVYAIGDAAYALGKGDKPLRMSCASGTPTAWQAADAIAARLTDGKLPTTLPRYFNQCISLGRKNGLIQYVTADDRPVNATLTGRLAAHYKELICKGAAWGVTNPTLKAPTRRHHLTPR